MYGLASFFNFIGPTLTEKSVESDPCLRQRFHPSMSSLYSFRLKKILWCHLVGLFSPFYEVEFLFRFLESHVFLITKQVKGEQNT